MLEPRYFVPGRIVIAPCVFGIQFVITAAESGMRSRATRAMDLGDTIPRLKPRSGIFWRATRLPRQTAAVSAITPAASTAGRVPAPHRGKLGLVLIHSVLPERVSLGLVTQPFNTFGLASCDLGGYAQRQFHLDIARESRRPAREFKPEPCVV